MGLLLSGTRQRWRRRSAAPGMRAVVAGSAAGGNAGDTADLAGRKLRANQHARAGARQPEGARLPQLSAALFSVAASVVAVPHLGRKQSVVLERGAARRCATPSHVRSKPIDRLLAQISDRLSFAHKSWSLAGGTLEFVTRISSAFRRLPRDRPALGLAAGAAFFVLASVLRWLLGGMSEGFGPMTFLPAILLVGPVRRNSHRRRSPRSSARSSPG